MKLPGIVQFRKCTLTNKELAQQVAARLNQMYDDLKVPERQIPARVDEDFDLLVGELIIRFMEATKTPFE